jgi:hypothetical protein
VDEPRADAVSERGRPVPGARLPVGERAVLRMTADRGVIVASPEEPRESLGSSRERGTVGGVNMIV